MGGPAAARRLRAFDWGSVCENNEKNVFDLNNYIYIYICICIYGYVGVYIYIYILYAFYTYASTNPRMPDPTRDRRRVPKRRA